MAIANTFTFGGASTTTYNVIVEGSGDYSGAKRAVEMISIPGRDGAFALDKGYFENEPVEYDVLIQGATQATFEAAVSSFRNAILSKKGYQRLTDTYHPNEYRMAVYAGGFDEEPTFHGKGASFKVKFDCKPQRWLTSGETAQTIAASGDAITNPTLQDAKPLLEVEGYGTIGVNSNVISIQNGAVGDITLAERGRTDTFTDQTFNASFTYTIELATGLYNTGDPIVCYGYIPESWGLVSGTVYIKNGYLSSAGIGNNIYNDNVPFNVGTSATKTVATKTTGPHNVVVPGGDGTVLGTYYTATDLTIQYDGNRTITYTGTISVTGTGVSYLDRMEWHIKYPYFIVNSSYSTTGGTIHIDLDLGEAWTENNGEIASANNAVSLPTKLPTLAPGSNTITFDNTITSLKITPRWWKL